MTPYEAIPAALDEGHTTQASALREAYRLCSESGDYHNQETLRNAWCILARDGRIYRVGRAWQAVRSALLAMVLLAALAGAAHAGNALVGSLDDDYGKTVRIYRSDYDGIVGVSIYGDGKSHIALLSRSQAHTLASMLESGWRKRFNYNRNTITGSVNGPDGSKVTVAVVLEPAPLQVSLAVEDTDTGMAASFWSVPGAIRYLANALRRAAR